MHAWTRTAPIAVTLVSALAAGCPAPSTATDDTASDDTTNPTPATDTSTATDDPTTSTMGPTTTVEPATDSAATDSAATDGATTDTDTDTDTDGPSYPECVPPNTALVEIAVTIDGTNDIFGTWDTTSTADIDGPCDVIAADPMAGTLSLTCLDLEGIERTVDIEYGSDPPVQLVLDEGPVELFFNYVWDTDKVFAKPPTEGISFAVTQGGTVRLAGLDAELSGSPYYPGGGSWPSVTMPPSVIWDSEGDRCDFESLNDCYGIERRRASFEVAGATAQLFDQDSAPLGELWVVLDRMDGSRVNPTADDPSGGDPCCCHGPPSFRRARFLIGTPR